jgi:hypothetical protein
MTGCGFLHIDHAVAQAVSPRPLTVETVRARVYPCGIFGGQSDTAIGSSLSSSAFPCEYHSTKTPYSYLAWWMNNRLVSVCSSETVSPHCHECEHFFTSLLPASQSKFLLHMSQQIYLALAVEQCKLVMDSTQI